MTEEHPPVEQPEAPTTLPTGADPADDLAIAAKLERLERKPPLYRFFRGGLYGLYGLAAFWVMAAIAWSTWQSVWGPAGQALKQRQGQQAGVRAKPMDRGPLPETPTEKAAGKQGE